MPHSTPKSQSPSQVARHFLHLLDDVYRIHGLFLDEINSLRARVKELETVNTTLTASVLPDIRGCAVYMVSMDGIIEGWSGGASELYGYSIEEVLGEPLQKLKSGTGPASAQTPMASRRVRKNGEPFEVFLHQSVLLDGNGAASGRMHVEVPIDHSDRRSGTAGEMV